MEFRKSKVFKSICFSLIFSFLSTSLTQAASLNLAPVNQFIPLSNTYSFPILKGLKFDPANPLEMKFIIDTADKREVTKEEASTLIRYFLAALTIPEEEIWVNLSPYEEDKIIPDALSQTDLGKDLLSQDYLLKQLTSSLTYPESDTGKDYWDKTYAEVMKIAKTTKLPINTFNKIWIVPEHAQVYESGNTAFIAEAKLKAMLEEDYLALKNKQGSADFKQEAKKYKMDEELVSEVNQAASKVMKELILPKINEDVNSGQNFATLRQVYHSLILGIWFKKKFRDSIYSSYINQQKVEGIDLEDKTVKEKVYQHYVEAFKKGLYDYIKTEPQPKTRKSIKRRYYSGGVSVLPNPRLPSFHIDNQFVDISRLDEILPPVHSVGEFNQVMQELAGANSVVVTAGMAGGAGTRRFEKSLSLASAGSPINKQLLEKYQEIINSLKNAIIDSTSKEVILLQRLFFNLNNYQIKDKQEEIDHGKFLKSIEEFKKFLNDHLIEIRKAIPVAPGKNRDEVTKEMIDEAIEIIKSSLSELSELEALAERVEKEAGHRFDSPINKQVAKELREIVNSLTNRISVLRLLWEKDLKDQVLKTLDQLRFALRILERDGITIGELKNEIIFSMRKIKEQEPNWQNIAALEQFIKYSDFYLDTLERLAERVEKASQQSDSPINIEKQIRDLHEQLRLTDADTEKIAKELIEAILNTDDRAQVNKKTVELSIEILKKAAEKNSFFAALHAEMSIVKKDRRIEDIQEVIKKVSQHWIKKNKTTDKANESMSSKMQKDDPFLSWLEGISLLVVDESTHREDIPPKHDSGSSHFEPNPDDSGYDYFGEDSIGDSPITLEEAKEILTSIERIGDSSVKFKVSVDDKLKGNKINLTIKEQKITGAYAMRPVTAYIYNIAISNEFAKGEYSGKELLDFIFKFEGIPGKIKTAITNALKKKGWDWEDGELVKLKQKEKPHSDSPLAVDRETELKTLIEGSGGKIINGDGPEMAWVVFNKGPDRDEFLKAAGIELSADERIHLLTVGLPLGKLDEAYGQQKEKETEKKRREEERRKKKENEDEEWRRSNPWKRPFDPVDPFTWQAGDKPGGIALEGISKDINPRPSSSPINLSPDFFENGLKVEIVSMQEMSPKDLNQFVLGPGKEEEKERELTSVASPSV